MRKLFILTALAATALASAQIVQNGDFELGLYQWNTAFSSYGLYRYDQTTFQDANGGTFLTTFGIPNTNVLGQLSQTVADTSGQAYTLAFDFGTLDITGNNNFLVQWDGNTVYDGAAAYNATNTLSTVDFNVSGTGSDTLSFTAYNQSNFLTGFDNVSLTPGATPEPATIFLASAGLIMAVRRRRTH